LATTAPPGALRNAESTDRQPSDAYAVGFALHRVPVSTTVACMHAGGLFCSTDAFHTKPGSADVVGSDTLLPVGDYPTALSSRAPRSRSRVNGFGGHHVLVRWWRDISWGWWRHRSRGNSWVSQDRHCRHRNLRSWTRP